MQKNRNTKDETNKAKRESTNTYLQTQPTNTRKQTTKDYQKKKKYPT